jgi:hypothetical protein
LASQLQLGRIALLSNHLEQAQLRLKEALALQPGQETPAQTMAMQQYGKTAPYVDLPLPQLKKAIRDLNGIKPDSTPEQLERILDKTGEAIALQLPRVPNLICREDVADEAPPKQESSDGMSQVTARVVGVIPGRGNLTQTPPTTKSLVLGDWHHFNYIIHANKEPDGTTTLEESRTGKGGGATPDPKGIASPRSGLSSRPAIVRSPTSTISARKRWKGILPM